MLTIGEFTFVEGKRRQRQVWGEQLEKVWANQLGNGHGLEIILGE